MKNFKNILQVFRQLPGIIFWKDQSLRYLGGNDSFLKLIGLKNLEELIGKKDHELPWSTEYADYFNKYDQEVLSIKREISAIRGEILIKNNQENFTITTDKYPFYDDDGEFIGVLGIASKVRSQELNSQIYLQNIIERIPYYIFWKNTKSVYLGCNQRFVDLVGKKSAREVIGKIDSQLGWGIGEPELFRRDDLNAMQGNPVVNQEELLKRPDGSEIVMLVSKVPLRDQSNNCIGVLGISTEITERKKQEQELRQAKEQAEAALRAKEEAERALREKSIDLQTVLQDMIQQKYYLTGKYKGVYLTKREAECLVCLARNMSVKEIAKVLKIKPRTVEMFLENARGKLNCHTKSQLVQAAIECRFLEGVRPVI